MVFVPAIITFILTGLCATPPMFAFGLTPLGFFLCVFCFGLNLPRTMPVMAVVALSLFADTVIGAPLGAHGVVALLVLVFVQRKAKMILRQSPPYIWLMLASALLASQLVLCLIYAALGYAVSVLSAGEAWLITLPLVPLVQWVAQKLEVRD